jgi:hypothetical protein
LRLDPIGRARIRALSAGAGASEAAASLAELGAEGRRARLAAAADAGVVDDGAAT